MIVGVLAMRNAAHFGRAPTDYQSFAYAATADAALAQLDAEYATWLAGVESLGEDGLARPCGEAEGPFADRPLAALVLHINRELIHHLAEVCLLRDLHLHVHRHEPASRTDGRRADMARDIQVTFDCADPAAVGRVLGRGPRLPTAGPAGAASTRGSRPSRRWACRPSSRNDASALVDPDGAGPRLFFQRVPEGKEAKNRVHLDVRAAPGLEGEARMAALEAEAERLVARGATRLGRHEPAPPLNAGHIVMADPEGNEFCLD